MEYDIALFEEGELPLSLIKDPNPVVVEETPAVDKMPKLVMDRHPFVTMETHARVMKFLAQLKKDWYCRPCEYTVPGTEQARPGYMHGHTTSR